MVYNEPTVTLESLREQHPYIIYESFTVEERERYYLVSFVFRMGPNRVFTPSLDIPRNESFSPELETLNTFAFHLGLIELFSYWKTACPPVIEVHAGYLDAEQLAWWHDLLLHGMGEFFYVNNIAFTEPGFVEWKCTASAPAFSVAHRPDAPRGNLILVGGGKDSVVSMRLLEQWLEPQQVLLVEPTVAATATASVAEYDQPIVVRRHLDPQLAQLNAAGYLNGHTPFSAMLSFVSVMVAWLHGLQYVIASNESSANEANLVFHGQEINHQYSKSERYEAAFRAYSQRHLTQQVEYFSLLRPLTELQIAALFAESEHADTVFSSCNVSRNNGWCGNCPKCAFVYLMLYPFMSPERLVRIFGGEFFEHRQLYSYWRALIGAEAHKPLECVGTEQESLHALALTQEKVHTLELSVPAELMQLFTLSGVDTLDTSAIRQHIVSDWENDNYVPAPFTLLLQNALKEL